MSRYNSRHYSRSRWSDWSGFSLRFVGALVVFAIAALSGAVIGGVSIYLINDAATPPASAVATSNPRPAPTDSAMTSAPAHQQASDATNGKPVRMVDPAFPPPVPTAEPSHPPAEATTQPPAGGPASSAAIQAPTAVSQPPAVMPPQSPPASAAASQAAPQDNLQITAHDAVARDAATQPAAPETGDHASARRKTAVTKKRATMTNAGPAAPQPSDQAQSATRRSVYDYYDHDDDQQRASATEPGTSASARRGARQTQQRIIVRRQDNYDRDSRDNQTDRRSAFPAQPRPAQSFGFFGDRRGDNDQY
jgi:hypothetical protein